MEINLLNSAKEFFNDDVLSKLGNTVGEDKEKVKSGLAAIIPAIFLGLQKESGTGLSAILEQAKQYFGDFNFTNFLKPNAETGEINELVDTDHNEPQHKDLLHTIFGNNLSTIVTTLGGFLGSGGGTIQKLLGLSLPAVFSSLTQNGTNWNASSITKLLDDNKSNFAAALPSGLGLAAFGTSFANVDNIVSSTTEATKPIEAVLVPVPLSKEEEPVAAVVPPVIPPPAEPVKRVEPIIPPARLEPLPTEEPKSGGGGIWKILIPIVIIAVLWFLFGKGCKGDKDKVAPMDTVSNNVTDTTSQVVSSTPSVRESLEVELPNGVKLNAFKGGIEDQLVQFLKTDYKALGEDALKDKWFNFDNLNFETNTAKVLPESQVQLENLAAILKAFPAAKIKIGGYTDKTGDESYNKKLSMERATVVKSYLSENGLSGQVIDAEGYGSEFAQAAADAPESARVLDRKVAVSVR
ncbi:OmpA family protein [Sphingobacterium sp. SRCM116780]|uniref:OmpA family protein n=1 Tax=Sphingobacterium sp. SRCM116780 TaxID=2907623 RepID=UPI001F3FC208|nr:OmpA family protein [Sphingobacterium sp. SRCM116780]UIR57149.1 OmpA family protein [Sphingobacterium sp. SRCM116780]